MIKETTLCLYLLPFEPTWSLKLSPALSSSPQMELILLHMAVFRIDPHTWLDHKTAGSNEVSRKVMRVVGEFDGTTDNMEYNSRLAYMYIWRAVVWR